MRLRVPKKGDIRTKTRFLWFPKRIGYTRRWLEKATWTEYYVDWYVRWRPLEWKD